MKILCLLVVLGLVASGLWATHREEKEEFEK